MARYHAGATSTGAGSSTLPVGSIYASASVAGYIVEWGIFNTTTTACKIYLARLSTAGTQGAGLVESPDNPAQPAASLTAVQTHTGTPPTLGVDLGYRATLGAAAGAGVIWTFDNGLYIPAGTANGIGMLVPSGTGQIVDWYVVWEE